MYLISRIIIYRRLSKNYHFFKANNLINKLHANHFFKEERTNENPSKRQNKGKTGHLKDERI